ncbi:DUF4180 domain-containing protein [Paenibacillaceae bacterium WGS1546]|uniref:DUF4180 domain-containing protein n=1 Tax=Cohnella sp. WGS1546 TaxID=3366810 RepID=UPI00372D795A
MNLTTTVSNGQKIAVVSGSEVVIEDVQSALDLMAAVQYETGCDRIVIPISMIVESFFDLKTRLAGDILQKFINYGVKAAFVGDFSAYPSRSLRDFINECNNGNDFFFLPAEREAIEKLSLAK